MLGMRSATVRSHLHRARIAMRNALEDAGFPQTNGRIGAPVKARESFITRKTFFEYGF